MVYSEQVGAEEKRRKLKEEKLFRSLRRRGRRRTFLRPEAPAPAPQGSDQSTSRISFNMEILQC
ncbi:uncharacterized protein AFUA_3G14360 [Aspergillus fumigatus Af293]|uniref:Uncharacterized protein n=2 Tax=Aspergillus fumigatus TaxID=746128 RepID=Q4WYV1_ASPFU|nr:hypothetical protein AFUA_3G14360 [Aspergillus fumigatus Af293]EAL92152.1 hypothetical protein AFUA_3G14360 [Aspergillus fumigatus Af293]EDP52323.1 hypothetical protein AFUB_034870 [Aspergillus fumigatus A1163]